MEPGITRKTTKYTGNDASVRVIPSVNSDEVIEHLPLLDDRRP